MYLMPCLTFKKESVHVYLEPPYCLHFGIMGRIRENGARTLRCERGLTLKVLYMLGSSNNNWRRSHSRLGDVCFNAHISTCHVYLSIYYSQYIFTYISICAFFPHKNKNHGTVTSTSKHLLMV